MTKGNDYSTLSSIRLLSLSIFSIVEPVNLGLNLEGQFVLSFPD